MSEKQETAIDMVIDIKNQVDELVREIATKDAEIATLKAAINPVLDLDMSKFGFTVDYGECFEAVREAQRIMKEGGGQ